MSSTIVDIDRLILTDVGVTPDRAEQIRALISEELQRLLVQQGALKNLVGRDVPYLSTPPLQVTEPHNDARLAIGLARHIAESMGNVG